MPLAPLPDQLAPAQRMWGLVAAVVGLVAGAVVFGSMREGAPPAAAGATPVFYANALLNFAALVTALARQRWTLRALGASDDAEDAAWAVWRGGAGALAALQAGALVAVSAAYLTGEAVNLAFLVPFFGFVAAFFPSAARVSRWRAIKRSAGGPSS